MNLTSAQTHTTRIQPRGIRIASSRAELERGRTRVEDKVSTTQNSSPAYQRYTQGQMGKINPVQIMGEVELQLNKITTDNFLANDSFWVSENLKHYEHDMGKAVKYRCDELKHVITTSVGNRLALEYKVPSASVYPLVAYQIKVSDVENIYTTALKNKLIS